MQDAAVGHSFQDINMPTAAPRYCTCGRHVVPARQSCPCAKARADATQTARPSASARGYDSNWRKASKAFLALPGNERCACGCGKPANVVDHIRAHKGDQRLFWDQSNWRAMNVACNSRKAAQSEGGFGNPRRAQ